MGTGQFIVQQAMAGFSWMLIGGIGIGLVVGWLFMQAHNRLPTDASSDIALTLIEPYFLYWIAEQLHSSGVLAVVSGGLFLLGRRLVFLFSASRIMAYNFLGSSFIFMLNGIVCMLIGLQLPQIITGLHADGISLGTAIKYGVLVTVILIAARIISSCIALAATIIFRPGVTPRIQNRRRMWKLPLLLGWTGMRGVVSLAAALAIPTTLQNGEPFPYKDAQLDENSIRWQVYQIDLEKEQINQL